MKPQLFNHRTGGWSRIDLAVVLAVIAILALLFFTWHRKIHRKLTGNSNAWRINCVNSLKQDALAFRIWAGDNNEKYPMQVSTRQGGAMEPAAAGDPAPAFRVMASELSTPKILLCPADDSHLPANNFKNFSRKNTSYFVGVNASGDNPNALLAGDANLEINGVPVKPGLADVELGTQMAWSSGRHKDSGNFALSDGSVQQVTQATLQKMVEQTGQWTNRIAIP